MKVFTEFFLILALGCSLGCNNVKDLQPIDPEVVPPTAVEALKRRYPSADDILMKTLVLNKLWHTSFKSNASQYETQLSATAIVGPVIRKADGDFSFYKSLTDQLSIKGGEFSDLRIVEGTTKNIGPIIYYDALMNYRLNGKSYQLHYSSVGESDQIRLISNFSTYYVLQPEDIPQQIVKFFSDNSLSLVDNDIYVFVDPAGLKTYRAYLKALWAPNPAHYAICFDKDFNLTWIGQNSDGSAVVPTVNSEIGRAELLAKSSKYIIDFKPIVGAFQTSFKGLQSVRYLFTKTNFETDGGSSKSIVESWQILTNPASEPVLSEEYMGYITRN
ncbi:hypothetical protein [Dyadobacter sp. LHD-138]|uniref:hypothetical protein n=1 Tax=Dyadobacter sp. LHD-138 TaxID=3071413 RepID=UPI0027DF0033|nr:hypothetical protein [Dyadobacter sp. LHD-138]MDQ6480534.1 hypothetical protein [Dyadobacter sp. LHD-138]